MELILRPLRKDTAQLVHIRNLEEGAHGVEIQESGKYTPHRTN